MPIEFSRHFRFAKQCVGLAVAAIAVAMGSVSPLAAQSIESFYKGKQTKMLVASGAGGGYDAYGRAVARHIVDHIPGKPNMIVQNMDGAGGLVAMNHLYNVADKDGTVMLATYNSLILQPMLDPKGVQYDTRKFTWIGSVSSQQNICATWYKSPVKTLDQAKTQQVIMPASGASSDSATTPKILNALVGTKFKVVMGYSTNDTRLAVERGEVDGVCGLSFSTLKASNPDWLEQKKVTIMTQMGLRKHPDMPDVPLVLDFVQNETDKEVLALLLSRSSMGRPFVAPPGIPADRAAALRTAFMETMADKAFIADATKMNLEIDPMTAEDMEKLIADDYASPKEIIDKASDLVAHL